MENEKRMADNYEITQAIRIGRVEIVYGVNEENECPYFCALYKRHDILGEYSDCVVSDDYSKIIALFASRIQEQGELLQKEREAVTVPTEVITIEQCIPDDYTKNIRGKVIVIRPELLQPEYRAADCQLWLCRGGFGANANSRGSGCYCVNLYSGEEGRWERRDVLGEMKELPDWVKERLAEIQRKDAEKERARKSKEER